jgi:hypothetical protein
MKSLVLAGFDAFGYVSCRLMDLFTSSIDETAQFT